MALNFKSLLTRTLTAAVFVAVLLSAINFFYLGFSALFFIISLWGLHEFFKIARLLGAKPFKRMAYFTGAILYTSVFMENTGFLYSQALMNFAICFSFLIFVYALFAKNEKPVEDVAYTFFGIFYCVVPYVLMNKLVCLGNFPCYENEKLFSLGAQHYNPHFILGVILLIWASDTYAYLVGSLMGKTKLNQRISPGKTWEGTVVGGILTLASSYIISIWFPEIQFVHWLVISTLVVVFGTLGDLFQSLLKRQAGIKDSGKIMPGHGGILDRFDSLMFVTPFVYLYLNWVLS